MKILKPKQVSEMLNVTTNTLQKWDREGTLSANRFPTGRRYYTQEQIDIFLEEGNMQNESK